MQKLGQIQHGMAEIHRSQEGPGSRNVVKSSGKNANTYNIQ